MARVARKSHESCYFHVIVQGYEKEYIFKENYLKEKYLKLLLSEVEKFKVELLEYCIMGNHAHILLYCEQIEQMSLYMKNVNTIYATFYNTEKNRVGYVFRDRFLSEPIMTEKHLYSCIPYIHMNPVVAKIVSTPEAYHYSSYNDFIYKNGIVTESVLMKLFHCKDNYINFFKFLHYGMNDELEFKEDLKKVSFSQAQNIIMDILNEYCLPSLENESTGVQKYFCRKFTQKRIASYHIEKILKIDHRKIKKMLSD